MCIHLQYIYIITILYIYIYGRKFYHYSNTFDLKTDDVICDVKHGWAHDQ